MKFWRVFLLAVAAFALSACSGLRIVDSDVSAFATKPTIAPGSTYRFERLPSQQQTGATQAGLEIMVDQALTRVNLRRDEANPQYSVQIGARVQRFERGPWDDPFWPGGGWGFPHRDLIVTASGQVVSVPSFPRMAMNTPWYEREVSLVMRDLKTGQVVYETHARHDGRWSDTQAVFPAMFQAALGGFPTPPGGVQRIEVQIPR